MNALLLWIVEGSHRRFIMLQQRVLVQFADAPSVAD
jgi:hypothetical protein